MYKRDIDMIHVFTPPPQHQHQQKQDPETALYTQKQCLNCRKFYTEIENNYNIPEYQQKPICIYTNKSPSTRTEAVQVKGVFSSGVRTSPNSFFIRELKHKEDLGYSAIVAKFPVHKESIEVIRQTHAYKAGVGAPSNDVADAEERVVDNADDFIIHNVAMTDTLVGVALYYQVKIEDIQRANNLTSHQIFHHKVLLIPRPDRPLARPERPPVEQSEEQIKARKAKQVKLFQQMSGVNAEEAKYYMELCEYRIDAAMEEWKTDSNWEAQNEKGVRRQQSTYGTIDQPYSRKARTCC